MWPKIQTEPMYVVKTDDDLFYIESPDDQGLSVHDAQETLIRLFQKKEQADIYKDILLGYLGLKPEQLAVVPISLQQIFEAYPKINNASKEGYGCPMRIEVCECKPDEFPTTVDTIITSTAIHN